MIKNTQAAERRGGEEEQSEEYFQAKNNLTMSSRCFCSLLSQKERCLDHKICLLRLFIRLFYNEIEDMRHEFIMSDLALQKR